MNKVILVGRLTNHPEVRYTQDNKAIATFSLAVDRKYKRDGEPTADFIRCVSFGKAAEFVEKYFTKGMRVAVSGHIQTGSYKDREGRTIYTTDIIVEEQEFAQSKSESGNSRSEQESTQWQQAEDDITLPW